MMKITLCIASLLLMINCNYSIDALSVVNVAQGIFSKKTESDRLALPATSTFEPITTLTTNIHIDKPYSVLVHYQITLYSRNKDFYSKQQINYANAGSLDRCIVETKFTKQLQDSTWLTLILDVIHLRYSTCRQ